MTTRGAKLDELMTITELAEYLQVPVTTIYAWNSQRTGPAYRKIGRHVRYLRSDVAKWLDASHPSG